ncbi:hypothetical protein [Serratia quinivorans]|uniref:hypothetical protein n=1 Tax=Serratia quinivorans TaxID=137545 RepID=UPI003982BA62
MDSNKNQQMENQIKDMRNNIKINNISWTLLERLIIFTYNRAKTWCVSLYIIALFLSYTTSYMVISKREFILNHINKESALVFLDYPSVIIACQVTLLAIVYPLIIGMVSVFIQKNEYSRRVFFVYQKHSGFIFLSLNGLTLSLFILTSHLLKPITPIESHYVSSIISVLWFSFSLILTGYFLISTINILNSDSREKLIIRDTFLDFYSNELKSDLVNSIAISTINNIITKKAKEYITPGKKNISFSQPNTIVVGFRPIVLRVASIFHYIKNRKQKLRLSVSSKHEEFRIHSEPSFVSLSFLERKLITISFKTKRKEIKNHIDNVISTITAPVIESIVDENLSEHKLAILKLINWHNSISTYSTIIFNGKSSNLLIKKSPGVFFHVTHLEKILLSYINLIDISFNKFNSNQSYFIELMKLHIRIYIYRESIDNEESELLIKYSAYAWNKLLSLDDNKSNKVNINKPITTFIEYWEKWVEYIYHKENNKININLMATHLIETIKLLPPSLESNNQKALDLSLDSLNNWFSLNKSSSDHLTDHFINDDILWNYELINIFNFQNQNTYRNLHAIFNSKHNYGRAAYFAVKNASIDTRIIAACYLIYNAKKHKKCFPSLLVQKLLSGKTSNSCDYFESSASIEFSDIINTYLRSVHISNDLDYLYNEWLNTLIDNVFEYTNEEYLISRFYSNREDYKEHFIDSISELLLITVNGNSKKSDDWDSVKFFSSNKNGFSETMGYHIDKIRVILENKRNSLLPPSLIECERQKENIEMALKIL